MLLGGEPMDGPRHIWWNFVSSSKERIEQAKEDWRAEAFRAGAGRREGVHPAAGVRRRIRRCTAREGVERIEIGRLPKRGRDERRWSARRHAGLRDCGARLDCRASLDRACGCWLSGRRPGRCRSSAAPRRSELAQAARLQWGIHELKEQLRRRLAEPRAPFADGTAAAPTLGAGAAFEARHRGGRPVPCCWRPAAVAARPSTAAPAAGNGNGTAQRQRGRLLAPARRAVAARQHAGCARAPTPGPPTWRPTTARRRCSSGVLYLRAGRLQAAEAAFRRQMETLATAWRRIRPALSRPHHAGRRAGRQGRAGSGAGRLRAGAARG